MATIGWICGYLVSLLVVVFLNYGESQEPATGFLKQDDAKIWAEKLSMKLDKFFDKVTPYTAMNLAYSEADKGPNKRITYRSVDGKKLVSEMADKLGIFLGKKVDALWNVVKRAENLTKNYEWDGKLKNAVPYYGEEGFVSAVDEFGSVEYVSSKLLKRDDPMLEYSPIFNQAVNLSMSSVHIPVEIYEGNIDILNGLKWTADLDAAFQENRERDPDLLWQFFGSQTGFMRTFPASRWRCFGEVDLYDVRRRPWYTQGSSSPKDMLILIDRSGSVHGQALQLIKVAVQSLLDTLGDNDFFNIIQFSSKAGFVHDCFNHTFVQANYHNKRILQKQVAQLNASGKADFKIALTFAFETFQRFRQNDTLNHGAKCNKVIMLLTDGGSDKAKEVFEKYNWSNNKTVRVFTYTIGSTSDPTESIRWMACANRGFFSPIPAMGAIRSKVQDYVKVLSRPFALSQPRDIMWTSVYKDTMGYMRYLKRGKEYLLIQDPEWFVRLDMEYIPVLSRPMGLNNAKHISWGNIRYDNTGLGMMTTVTLPVYNRSQDASNQTILGVMGVDVTTRRLMEATPLEKLTPNGYSFAINKNGYIIFHPDLKAQNGWLQDPPNVDFLDLEYETEQKEIVRTKMIDGESGSAVINTFLVQVDQKHIIEVNRTYFYTSINNSDFSLALVIPGYAEVYPEVTKPYTIDEGIAILKEIKDGALIPLKDYYENYTKSNRSAVTGTVQDLVDADEAGSVEWDDVLLQRLFLDADVTRYFGHASALLAEKFVDSWKGVLAVFIGTDSGLTRYCPADAAALLMDERDTWRTAYYKRALDSDNYIFIAQPDGMIDGNDTIVPDVTMVKAVSVKTTEGKTYKPAVVGLKMEHRSLLDLMAQINLNEVTCNDSEAVVCYLLDDGGFVIATNQEDKYAQVGHFFGTVDDALMYALVNESDPPASRFYYSKIRYDYQASCLDERKESSIAGLRSLRIPTISMLYDFLTVNWWTSQITWTYVNFNLYNWLFGPSSSTVYAQEGEVADEGMEEEETDCSPIDENAPSNHSCTKYEAHYYFVPGMMTAENSIYCGNCTRQFVAARVANTNLLLVVADPDCTQDGCQYQPILQAPIEDKDPDDCHLQMRYRRRPEGCYSEDDHEDDSQCNSVVHQPSTVFILLAALITVIICRHFSQGFT